MGSGVVLGGTLDLQELLWNYAAALPGVVNSV